jgi:UDP-glucose 4-epimerase
MTKKFEEIVVLVTGGGGYIGSHCILQLLQHNFKVVAVDNFENASIGETRVARWYIFIPKTPIWVYLGGP